MVGVEPTLLASSHGQCPPLFRWATFPHQRSRSPKDENKQQLHIDCSLTKSGHPAFPRDYKLQYTIATMATIISTIRNIQSVISVSQTINPTAPIIITVITIAANNFIQSISLYISRNKFYPLHYHRNLFQLYL